MSDNKPAKPLDTQTLVKLRARFFKALWPALFILFSVYLLKQAVWGDRGVFTWQTLRNQVFVLEQQNATLTQQMQLLEDTADRLSGQDPDAIDIEIRKTLPMLRPDEYLIILPTTPNTQ